MKAYGEDGSEHIFVGKTVLVGQGYVVSFRIYPNKALFSDF